jgi:hypothetical protein
MVEPGAAICPNSQSHPNSHQSLPAIPPSFFASPAEQVAPELIGCLLVKRQANGELLWGVVVETEAYCQSEPACHGHRYRTPSNETLFGEPGHWYVYVSNGIHHCVKRVAFLLTEDCLPAGKTCWGQPAVACGSQPIVGLQAHRC